MKRMDLKEVERAPLTDDKVVEMKAWEMERD